MLLMGCCLDTAPGAEAVHGHGKRRAQRAEAVTGRGSSSRTRKHGRTLCQSQRRGRLTAVQKDRNFGLLCRQTGCRWVEEKWVGRGRRGLTIQVPKDVLGPDCAYFACLAAVPVNLSATFTGEPEKMSQRCASSPARAVLANQLDVSAACDGRAHRAAGSSRWRFVGLVGWNHRHIGLGVGLVRFGPLRGRA